MVFDHVDGFWPVYFFRPMRWFLTSLIDFNQCYGFRPYCLIMLMVFDHADGFGPVDCFRPTILTMLMFFDHVDGFWPVDCFRPMGRFWWEFLTMSMVLDQLIFFDQRDGFWPVWSVLISVMGSDLLFVIVVVLQFWPCWWFLTMSMVFDCWLFLTNGIIPDQFDWL